MEMAKKEKVLGSLVDQRVTINCQCSVANKEALMLLYKTLMRSVKPTILVIYGQERLI